MIDTRVKAPTRIHFAYIVIYYSTVSHFEIYFGKFQPTPLDTPEGRTNAMDLPSPKPNIVSDWRNHIEGWHIEDGNLIDIIGKATLDGTSQIHMMAT
ncbi:MAG: hypothetical protein QXJ13_07980 [Candidatus Bathyarchaeia archaeon]